MISAAHPSPKPERHLDRFSRFRTGDRTVSLYFTMGRHFPPSKLLILTKDLDPHLTHGSFGQPESSTQTASRSVQQFFAELTSVTDRQTDRMADHANWSVTIGRIYVRSTAMRPKMAEPI